MSVFKYFCEERFALSFISDGEMRFGSLASYRGMEDGGIRGDPWDATLHYAPPEGIEITMVADGKKVNGVSFTTAVENMFVFCASQERTAKRAAEFGRYCVEIADIDAILRRLRARASVASRLDYARVIAGPTEYRPLDKVPGTDWAFPEKIAFIKPPEYAGQNEFRIAIPLKPNAVSADNHIFVKLGSTESITKLHFF